MFNFFDEHNFFASEDITDFLLFNCQVGSLRGEYGEFWRKNHFIFIFAKCSTDLQSAKGPGFFFLLKKNCFYWKKKKCFS